MISSQTTLGSTTSDRRLSMKPTFRKSNMSTEPKDEIPKYVLYALPPSSNCNGSKECLRIVKENNMETMYAPSESGLEYSPVVKVINAGLLDLEECPEWLVGVPTLFETGSSCVYKGESACARLQSVSRSSNRKYWLNKAAVHNRAPSGMSSRSDNTQNMQNLAIRSTRQSNRSYRAGQSMTFDSKRGAGTTEALQMSFASRQGTADPTSIGDKRTRGFQRPTMGSMNKSEESSNGFKSVMSTSVDAPNTGGGMIATGFNTDDYNTAEAAEHKLPESVIQRAKAAAKRKNGMTSKSLLSEAKMQQATKITSAEDTGSVDLASAFQKRKTLLKSRT